MSLCKAVEALIKSKPSEGKTISLTLKDGCVTTQKLANEAVSTGKLEEGAVTQGKIAEGAVGEHELEDGSVTKDKIASSAVTAEKISQNAVTAEKIAEGAVTEGKLSDNSVGNSNVEDNAITTSKIHDESITRAKMAPESIATEHIIDSSVTREKMAVDSVSTDSLCDGSVAEEKIINGAITPDKLADNCVSVDKLSVEVQDTLKLYDFVARNGYKYIGMATPETKPETDKGNVLYIAATEGSYDKFATSGGILDPSGEVTDAIHLGYGEVALLLYNGYEELQAKTLDTKKSEPILKAGWSKVTLPFVMKDVYEAKVKELESKASTGSVVEGYYDSQKNIFRSVPQYDSSGADVWIDEVEIGPGNPSTVISTKYANKMDDAHNRIYIDLSTNKAYRYNDNGYVQLVF